MEISLAAFDEARDARAYNACHDLCEWLFVGFVVVFCGASGSDEMSGFGRARKPAFGDFLKLLHTIKSRCPVTSLFPMINPMALAMRPMADLFVADDVITADGRALCGTRATRSRLPEPGRWCPATPLGCA